ncbi:MAG: NAD-dependent epimerase/dehydratase family protein [Candidatus Odinarchaeota archaeon]
MNDELHIVFGASGGIGNAVIRNLVARGKKVRGVNRSGKANVPNGVEVVPADLLVLNDSLKASEGATHIYNCVNVVYDKWKSIYPDVSYRFIELLKITGAKGIIADNLYMYGEEITEPYRESMEYMARGKKGRLRAKCAMIYEQAMKNGEIQAVICRAPDFYGPGVTFSSFYGDRLFPNILDSKNVTVMGKLDAPHAIIFVEDFAKAIINLALDDGAYGQVWHAPMDTVLTQREFIETIYEEAGTIGKIRSMNPFIARILGLFVPIIREVNEMMYEFVKPYLVNTSKYEERYGKTVTSHREAIRQTLDWYRSG